MTIDGYDEPLSSAATTTIADGKVQVDFTGTSPAARFGINSPLAYTTAYSVFGLACAIAPRVPNNAGSLSPYHVSAPPHTIVNAWRPHRWPRDISSARCCPMSSSAACARQSRIACPPKVPPASIS
jgi:N-methylhydantoinase B/acetone carboxylase, alpha subunit